MAIYVKQPGIFLRYFSGSNTADLWHYNFLEPIHWEWDEWVWSWTTKDTDNFGKIFSEELCDWLDETFKEINLGKESNNNLFSSSPDSYFVPEATRNV